MGRLADLLRHKMQMLREDAQAVAGVVEEAFKGHSELEDDELDASLRQVFYDLQDAKVLDVRRREYDRDGERLRGYTWTVLDEDAGLRPEGHDQPRDPVEELYQDLGAQAWQRRQPDPSVA